MKETARKSMAALIVLAGIAIFLAVACSPGVDKPKDEAAGPAPVTLIPEGQVRLSNDPAKTELFRDAGLGLFIHWGPNSQLGTEISWPLNNASDDYVKRYYALAETFNPTAFDAAAWARLAKLAGIEYVCFTAKHHDGYAMFDTAYSDFKITKSPYGKDIAAAVAEAFRRENILVGFYYSPGDFRYQFETGLRFKHLYEPDFAAAAPFGPRKLGFADYERGQVEELLTKYGDVFMIWFDGACEPLKKRSWQVKQDVFIGRGEIPTPEQEIPGKADDRAWESCLTTSWQWAYQPNASVRTAPEVIHNLIHIRARGGNMLLNIGPRPDGAIAPADEALLRELGLWMSLYGEGVRGVRPWAVTNEGGVWLTTRRSDGTVYAFSDLTYGLAGVKSPAGARFTLKSVKAGPNTQVSVLSQAGGVEWSQDKTGLHVTVDRTHTVQLIGTPAALAKAKGDKAPSLTWGPDWPIVVKITNAEAVAAK